MLGAYRCHERPQQQVQATTFGVILDVFLFMIVGLPASVVDFWPRYACYHLLGGNVFHTIQSGNLYPERHCPLCAPGERDHDQQQRRGNTQIADRRSTPVEENEAVSISVDLSAKTPQEEENDNLSNAKTGDNASSKPAVTDKRGPSTFARNWKCDRNAQDQSRGLLSPVEAEWPPPRSDSVSLPRHNILRSLGTKANLLDTDGVRGDGNAGSDKITPERMSYSNR